MEEFQEGWPICFFAVDPEGCRPPLAPFLRVLVLRWEDSPLGHHIFHGAGFSDEGLELSRVPYVAIGKEERVESKNFPHRLGL